MHDGRKDLMHEKQNSRQRIDRRGNTVRIDIADRVIVRDADTFGVTSKLRFLYILRDIRPFRRADRMRDRLSRHF